MLRNSLKKKIIKKLVILGLSVVAMIAIGLFVSGYHNKVSEDLGRLNQKLVGTRVKIDEAKVEEKDREEAIKLSNYYLMSGNLNQSKYNRVMAKLYLSKMRQRFGLSDLQLSINNFENVESVNSSQPMRLKVASAIVKFASSYDVPTYEFLAALEDSLPGIVVIKEIDFSKKIDVSSEGFKLSQFKGGQDVIMGQVAFDWFAITDSRDNRKLSTEEMLDGYNSLLNIEDLVEVDDMGGSENPINIPVPEDIKAFQEGMPIDSDVPAIEGGL